MIAMACVFDKSRGTLRAIAGCRVLRMYQKQERA